MNIFITGASGFIGGAIAAELCKKHSIRAMSRSERSDARLKELGVEPVRCSLGDVPVDALKNADIIIHCAAFVGPWGSKQDFWQGNVEGTDQILQAAKQAGVKRFIHIGTEAAFFAGKDMVQIDESYPYPPKNPYLYGSTKQEAEKRVLAANEPGFETIVLRPRLVWGPGDTSVLPVMKRMVEEGKFMWVNHGRAKTSTTCIPNLVHAVELALTSGQPGQAYFITDGEDHTFKDFLTKMLGTQNVDLPSKSVPGFLASGLARIVEGTWRIFGIKSEPPLMRFPTDLMARECTIKIDRARRELGYAPVISVQQGLDAMRKSGSA